MDLSNGITQNPNRPQSLNNRGIALRELKRYDEALADFNRIEEIAPYYLRTYINRAGIYMRQSKFESAIKDFDTYLSFEPNDGDMLQGRGVAHYYLGNYQEALRDYDLSISLVSDRGDFHLNRSQVYADMGNKQKALDDALKSRELGHNVSEQYIRSLQQ